MGVSSYFEFVVVAFGWICYDAFWSVLSETGVVFLPFIGIVISNVVEAKKAGDDEGSAAVQSLKKNEVDVVIAVFVLMVAGAPLFTVDMGQMRYVRPALECGVAGGGVVTAGDAAAPYGPVRAVLSGREARIPLWWAGFHQLSKAVSAAAMAGVPCTSDVRMLHHRVGTAAIADENALRSAREFAGQCHRRALSMWREGQRYAGSPSCTGTLPDVGGCVPALPGGDSGREGVTAAEQVKATMPYIGSPWLAANIYPALQSTVDASGLGFARQLPRDGALPDGAYPMCDEWWAALRPALVAAIDDDLWDDATDPDEGHDGRPRGWYARAANMWPYDNAGDAALAAVMEGRFRAERDSGDGFGNVVSYDPDLGEQVGGRNIRAYLQSESVVGVIMRRIETGVELAGGLAGDTAGYVGAAKKAFAMSAEGMVIRETVSMVQGLAQLVFIVGLPFMLVFSAYGVGKLVLFTIVFFSIHFLSVLWGIAFWVDNSLASILDWRHTGPTQTVMLHMVTKTMFVVVPSMWMAMMAWAGWSAGGLVDQGIGQVGGAARDAGETGARTVTSAAGASVRAAGQAVGGPLGAAGAAVGKGVQRYG